MEAGVADVDLGVVLGEHRVRDGRRRRHLPSRHPQASVLERRRTAVEADLSTYTERAKVEYWKVSTWLNSGHRNEDTVFQRS